MQWDLNENTKQPWDHKHKAHKPWKSKDKVSQSVWHVYRSSSFSAPAYFVIGKVTDDATKFFTNVFGKPDIKARSAWDGVK